MKPCSSWRCGSCWACACVRQQTLLRNGRRLDHVRLILLAIEDITERKQAEEDLLQLNETLETRIFEIFKTLKPRDEVEGSGIGLAVVKRLVETRGGAIQVTSAAKEGASFRFRWPVSISPGTTAAPA